MPLTRQTICPLGFVKWDSLNAARTVVFDLPFMLANLANNLANVKQSFSAGFGKVQFSPYLIGVLQWLGEMAEWPKAQVC